MQIRDYCLKTFVRYGSTSPRCDLSCVVISRHAFVCALVVLRVLYVLFDVPLHVIFEVVFHALFDAVFDVLCNVLSDVLFDVKFDVRFDVSFDVLFDF